ncbi:hypothetical protein Q8A73_008551 [Channa argus]|nr:hypothetical protein Q8A73_008551 [Channa argus]
MRSLTSAVPLGNDICGPPHCSNKRPHASPGFTAQEEEEEEEKGEARLKALSEGQRDKRPLALPHQVSATDPQLFHISVNLAVLWRSGRYAGLIDFRGPQGQSTMQFCGGNPRDCVKQEIAVMTTAISPPCQSDFVDVVGMSGAKQLDRRVPRPLAVAIDWKGEAARSP